MTSRATTSGLARVSIGVVPIVWNNVDLADAGLVPAQTVLDEIARLGYEGCQFGRGFPVGADLQAELRKRSLRLAEVYVALPFPGSVRDARESGWRALEALRAGGGDVLVVALEGNPDRDAWSGRASNPAAPTLGPGEWSDLAAVLNELGEKSRTSGQKVAFHAHTGTYVETPDELVTLAVSTDPEAVRICLDTGHYIVGGGDPVSAVRALGERVEHVHVKDVDPVVLERLRHGELAGFEQAVRERIFTELGAGMLDLDRLLAELASIDYSAWLMVEQDTTWLPPSEAAAIGRRVLAFAMRRLGADLAA